MFLFQNLTVIAISVVLIEHHRISNIQLQKILSDNTTVTMPVMDALQLNNTNDHIVISKRTSSTVSHYNSNAS